MLHVIFTYISVYVIFTRYHDLKLCWKLVGAIEQVL